MEDLHVLVVDDEAPTRERLTDLIEKTEGLTLLAACTDGRTAIERILRDEPDLVFLDVQMPGLDGIEVVRLVGPDRMPAVTFVTAYDRYAMKAFELATVDYLLKPFREDRFRQAVARAREQIRHSSLEDRSEQMMELLRSAGGMSRTEQEALSPQETVDPEEAGALPVSNEEPLIKRIAVQRRSELELVPIEEVLYFEAEGVYVNVHTNGHAHLIRERMNVLEERLSPEQFCRVHRSTIVNLDHVEALERTDLGDIVARLTTGKRLRVSRSRQRDLKKQLGL